MTNGDGLELGFSGSGAGPIRMGNMCGGRWPTVGLRWCVWWWLRLVKYGHGLAEFRGVQTQVGIRINEFGVRERKQ